MNPGVLADPGHGAAADGPPADTTLPSRVDYARLFRGRSFDRERVVKPADSLVRYRYPFVCGLIDPSLFPLAQWRECVRDAVSVVGVGNCATDFSETDDQMLIEQLIQRVLARRGIFARPDEVLVTVGGQQALYIAIRLLLAPGETIGIEDPGYPDVVNMARIEGINVQRLPVDEDGLILSKRLARCKCLYVTPSHQFPTTVTMPLARKSRLLELTQQNGQFIIEDDYESEVSFNKTPPRALKSLARHAHDVGHHRAGARRGVGTGTEGGGIRLDQDRFGGRWCVPRGDPVSRPRDDRGADRRRPCGGTAGRRARECARAGTRRRNYALAAS